MKKIVTIIVSTLVAGVFSVSAASKGDVSTKKVVTGRGAIKKETHMNETKEEQIKRLISEGKITQAQADTLKKMDKRKTLASSTDLYKGSASSSLKRSEKRTSNIARPTQKSVVKRGETAVKAQ